MAGISWRGGGAMRSGLYFSAGAASIELNSGSKM